VHTQVERQILGRGQRGARRGDPLDGRLVREVQKQHGSLDGARLGEVANKELRFLERDAHRTEHDRERVAGAEHLGLTDDLGRKPVVG